MSAGPRSQHPARHYKNLTRAPSLILPFVLCASLEGTIPTEIGALTKLEKLYLYTNEMQGALRESRGSHVSAPQKLRAPSCNLPR